MRAFVGRTVGAVVPLPTNDRDKPWLAIGANEEPNMPPSGYGVPTIEIRYEISEESQVAKNACFSLFYWCVLCMLFNQHTNNSHLFILFNI